MSRQELSNYASSQDKTNSPSNPEVENIGFSIETFSMGDLPQVEKILRYWFIDFVASEGLVPDENEFAEYLEFLGEKEPEDKMKRFFVARDEISKKVVGIFGYTDIITDSDLSKALDEVDVGQEGQGVALDFLRLNREEIVQFRFLFVDKDQGKRGIGKSLVTEGYEDAKASGIKAGFFFNHDRFKETSFAFHSRQQENTYLGDVNNHDQNCAVFAVML